MLTRRGLILSAAAQTLLPPAAPRTQAEAFGLFRDRALYLPLSEWYRTAPAANAAFANGNAQAYAQRLAMNGDEVGAWRATRAAFGPPPHTDTPDLSDVKAQDALEAVAHAARGKRVVSINDDHPSSRTRAFAHALALRLHREGFRLLAAETFEPGVLRLNDGPTPLTPSVGYYTSDPVYAEMLRDLRERGWRFAAYEARADQKTMTDASGAALTGSSARDEAQARNLAAVIQGDPDAKVLIFSGEAHAAKRSPTARMGERLMRLGVDFVGVSQLEGLPALSAKEDTPLMAAALARYRPNRPVALVRTDGRAVETETPGAFDVSVIHPRLADVYGRPGWLAMAPARRLAWATLPPGTAAGALVQTVPSDEAAEAVNAIPADQYPLPRPGLREAAFLLRPGRYEVRIETLEGRRTVGRLVVSGSPAAAVLGKPPADP